MPTYATTVTSNSFPTTDPYINYGCATYCYNDLTVGGDNKSRLGYQVVVYRSDNETSGSEHKYAGCVATTKVKIDGTLYTHESYISDEGVEFGWVEPTKKQLVDPGSMSGTTTCLVNASEGPIIEHNFDGTKTVYIEIKVTITDPNTSEILVNSEFNGYYLQLIPIRREPYTDVSYSIQFITEHSIGLYATASNVEWYGQTQSDHYAYWFYTIDDGENWIYSGESGPIVSRKTTNKLINVTGLEPNSSCTIVIAVSSDWENYQPGDTPATDDPRHPKFGFSPNITLTTDDVLPIPDIPSTRGIARRITLFDQSETEFTSNGLGSLIEAFSCKVTEEINGMFELEMEYPVDGRHFNDIDFGRIITANPNQYSRPQPFRIYSISKPHDGKVTINAQHISYDLSGITVNPFRAGSAMGIFAEFQYGVGGACDVPCPFHFWTDLSTYEEYRLDAPATIRSLMGGSDSSIQSIYGGEYEFDVYNVRLWTRRGVDRGVTIRYGKNLTSLKQDANCNNVYTGVRAFWYKEPGEDDPHSGGLVETMPKILTIPGTFNYDKILLLDLSGDFDEKPSVNDLTAAAAQYINDHNIGVPEVSLSVSFVQLSDSIEYQDVSILEQVKLGDYVSVEFPKLNIRANGIECVKTVFNVMSQRYDSIDLGTPKATLATTVSNNSQVASTAASKNDVQHAINTNTGDSSKDQTYVVMDRSVSPARLLVMDAAKQENATNIYKWSFDGLSHSSSGIYGPYSNIMKQDASEFNFPGEINCIKMTQVTPNMEVKNGHILKILRW